jgi:hypothetical protein
MSLQEIESKIAQLSSVELTEFIQWFERFAGRASAQAKQTDEDRTAWATFSTHGLARAYSDTEPEYTIADVKAS